jgi:N-acetylated-alpha-linked acidic dipeptidase
MKKGWKPRRTIILAAWDGEEWGLLGSTEWVEKHQQDLAKKAVAYINSDSTGKGWLSMSGSHSLQTFINEVARDVPDPRGGPNVLEAKRTRLIEQASDEKTKTALRARRDLAIDALGSGSDYTAFLDYLQIASLDLGFGGDGGGGVYHSVYDSFYWYSHFSDGTFVHSAALSRVIGTAMLRLADADVLPFEFRATAATLREYVEEIARMPEVEKRLDLKPIRDAIETLDSQAAKYEKAMGRLDRLGARADLAKLNEALYTSERSFRYDAGLPRREWFKHVAYAPGFYTGYGVKTLPGIREGVEQNQWEEAKTFVPIVADAIRRLAADVTRATDLLKEAAR